jgi:hypothetical protein
MSTATIRLARGNGHDCGKDEEGCLFEWYNWLTRQRSTDACPPGVSKVLHVFGMRLNDALPDDRRQELVRFLPNGTSPLAGTAGDGRDETRGYMALDWLIRTYLPAWLELAGLDAAQLRAHARVDSLASAQSIGLVVRAAWDAAGDAAGDAAAGAAAWDAAGDAARAAAGDAAWAAAWVAAGDAAGDAAWVTAWVAAGAVARDMLAPTVARLQDSAIALYDQMIPGEWAA